MQTSALRLVWPSLDRLPGIEAALREGWSPNTSRDVAREELQKIEDDPVAYVEAQVDREARGAPITLPDGTRAQRLPGFVRWMWDGEFCGTIGLRWRTGTTDLPPHCLGHIGYAVVPWKRRRGYATHALGLILDDARDQGLPFVIVSTDPDNAASQKVIEANGGVLVEGFRKPAAFGGAETLRYRITLA